MARGQRYSRILSAAKYYAAIDNYIKYITDSTKRGQRVGQGENRLPTQAVFLKPFSVALHTTQYVKTSGTIQTLTTYAAALGERVQTPNIPAQGVPIKLQNFSPAKVKIVTGRLPEGRPETSKVTGMKYLSYGGRSRSIPFGRNGTETQAEAFTAIRTAILNTTAGAIVTLTPEKYSV